MALDPHPLDPAVLLAPTLAIDSWGRRHRAPSAADRLKNGVPNWGESDSCWVWTRSTSPKGYGRIRACGESAFAHRVSYAVHYGIDPAELRVLHRCDNPPCVNPGHLFLGTQADNSADMIQKGRGDFPVNERNGRTTISSAKVEEIRARASEGESFRSIARDIGVHSVTVSRIARRLRRVA